MLSEMVWLIQVAPMTTEEIDFTQKAWIPAKSSHLGLGNSTTHP